MNIHWPSAQLVPYGLGTLPNSNTWMRMGACTAGDAQRRCTKQFIKTRLQKEVKRWIWRLATGS